MSLLALIPGWPCHWRCVAVRQGEDRSTKYRCCLISSPIYSNGVKFNKAAEWHWPPPTHRISVLLPKPHTDDARRHPRTSTTSRHSRKTVSSIVQPLERPFKAPLNSSLPPSWLSASARRCKISGPGNETLPPSCPESNTCFFFFLRYLSTQSLFSCCPPGRPWFRGREIFRASEVGGWGTIDCSLARHEVILRPSNCGNTRNFYVLSRVMFSFSRWRVNWNNLQVDGKCKLRGREDGGRSMVQL